MKTYTVVFEKTPTGWCAFYPDVPGLGSCGRSFEEIKKLTLEGLEFHLQAMLRDGDPLPSPKHLPEYLEIDLTDELFTHAVREVQAA